MYRRNLLSTGRHCKYFYSKTILLYVVLLNIYTRKYEIKS